MYHHLWPWVQYSKYPSWNLAKTKTYNETPQALHNILSTPQTPHSQDWPFPPPQTLPHILPSILSFESITLSHFDNTWDQKFACRYPNLLRKMNFALVGLFCKTCFVRLILGPVCYLWITRVFRRVIIHHTEDLYQHWQVKVHREFWVFLIEWKLI